MDPKPDDRIYDLLVKIELRLTQIAGSLDAIAKVAMQSVPKTKLRP